MSEVLKDTDISKIGHAMRTTRNTDLYGGGKPVSEKEAEDYLRFVERVVKTIQERLADIE